jgi:hypothetical protein
MWSLKTIVGILIIFCVCTMTFSLRAQEEPAYMYSGEKAEQVESDSTLSDTIYTGKVIAYGELLKPPYILEFKDDIVWVNNIPIFPLIRTFQEEQPEILETETRKRQRELSKQCFSEYMDGLKRHGVDVAKNMILNKYSSDSLIEKIEFYPRSTGITIKFADGYETHTGFFGEISPDGIAADYNRIATEEELIDIRKVEFDMIKSQLSRGFLKIFGYSYILDINPQRALEILNTLRSIARGEQTYEQVHARDQSLLPSPRNFWKEFDQKKDSWK